MPEIQKPYCQAMVLCEAAHRCPVTGKWTLLGTFSRLQATTVPIKSQLVVYFVLTDGNGDIPVGLRIVSADNEFTDESQVDEPAQPEPIILHFSDPLVSVEGIMGLEFSLSRFGVYHCELYSGDKVLMARRLILAEARQQNE